MSVGKVNADLEAVTEATVRGPGGAERRVKAVIDTGYGGTLTLPLHIIDDLGLSFDSQGRVELGDGREVLVDLYEATLSWNGRTREVLIDVAETAPLMGTALLEGSELCIAFEAKGDVTTKSLR